MRTIREDISRKEVITFYVEYDRRKKKQDLNINLTAWLWNNPKELDNKLRENKLKPGVLSAYKSWWLVELDYKDILDCAIVDHIFPDNPQTLGILKDQGVIKTWTPKSQCEWWKPLSSGSNLPCEWALILRLALESEHPAKWYIEDGSGRALTLVQRVIRNGDESLKACAYLGIVPDERSSFIQSRPELLRRTQ
jgi:hypothetical protein